MNPVAGSRRSFLGGKKHGSNDAIKPPWATQDFYQRCERCDDCIKACEEKILIRSDGGFPVIDFKRGGKASPTLDQNLCNSCGFCISVCPVSAITMEKTL